MTRERSATLCSFHALEPVKQTEPNIFQVPVRYPFQCGEFVFWNEDGRARCSPADNRNTYISGTDAVNKLFEAIASCARSATSFTERDAAFLAWLECTAPQTLVSWRQTFESDEANARWQQETRT